MDETISNEAVSLFEESRPLKPKDIRHNKWANIIARCKKQSSLASRFPSGVLFVILSVIEIFRLFAYDPD